MIDWQRTVIASDCSIRDALAVIDQMRIGVVVDQDGRLVGTVTDGDVRRGLLRSVSLDEPVTAVVNAKPHVAQAAMTRAEIAATPEAQTYRFIPVVDDNGRVVGLHGFVTSVSPQERTNAVVLMAGGLGKRLRPLTDDTPKPMLQIGARPLLETILLHIAEQGFRRFYFSVNYRAEMVKDHFGNGERWNVSVRYLEETQQMGTAGALSLLPERPTEPFVVMNGDLLTKVDIEHLLDYHNEHKSVATMCVREYDIQVPFGVLTIDGNRILGIEEKPTHKFFVNAGIYVFSPEVLDLIEEDEYLDMPSLFQRMVDLDMKTVAFPIREYWMDIGRIDDFRRANSEFGEVFS